MKMIMSALLPESDSLTDEEEEEEKLPSLAVRRRTSSRIDSTSHIEPTGNNN